MEVTIEKPGHYVFETKNGLDIKNLPAESHECGVEDLISILNQRDFDHRQSVLEVGAKSVRLVLNFNPSPTVFSTVAVGTVKESTEIKFLQINKSGWTPTDLAKAVRFNPHLFESAYSAADFAKKLINLSYKKQKESDTTQDTRGNKKSLTDVRTESNLPEIIDLFVRITGSSQPIPLRVEIELNPHDDLIYLVNVNLNAMINEQVRTEIDAVVATCKSMSIPVIHV